MSEAARLAAFHAHAQVKLADIAMMLERDARLTLVVRFPGKTDQDMVVTNEAHLPDAIKALESRLARDRLTGGRDRLKGGAVEKKPHE